MNELDVLPLEDAKAYLMVDFDDDDALITSLIKAAVDVFERSTYYRLYQRAETIQVGGYETEIFSFPRRSVAVTDYYNGEVVTPSKYNDNGVRLKIGFNNGWCYSASSAPYYIITMDVGFTTASAIPQGIIQWLKECVTWFYEKRNSNEVSQSLLDKLNPYKRFILW